MKIISTLSSLLKGKALVVILVGAVIAGGATAVMAATPMGQNAVHSMNSTSKAAATAHPTAHSDQDKNDDKADKDNKNATNNQTNDCPAMPAVQRLATEFGLSTAATSNTIKTICALHDGAFKGTTTAGAAVSSTRVFGLGEIEALLAMAKHNSGTLTDVSVQAQVANVLQHCGSKAVMECVKSDIPNFHATNGDNGNDHNGHGD